MGEWIGVNRRARKCYGFDEVSLVPGRKSINPEDVDTSVELCGFKLPVPILAAAMDGVVDPKFAVAMSKMGGIAVLNLEGIYTRYKNPYEVIDKIVKGTDEEATKILQEIYLEPVKEELIYEKIKEIKSEGALCAVSSIPQKAPKYGKIAQEAGADIFVVQATVLTVNHFSSQYEAVELKKLCQEIKIPVIMGNCVTYEVGLDLMNVGADAILVGVGPGTACTTRGVLGIGVPQVTATLDVAAARDYYYKKTGKYVPVITDGGMRRGGDICKAIAAGADAVMIGSVFARAQEAPGKGYHWGMATPHPYLPRGTRIFVGTTGSLKEILFGPAKTDDGSQNLVGALQTSMGNLGAITIREMHEVEIIIAPSIQTEGKLFQAVQRVGMMK